MANSRPFTHGQISWSIPECPHFCSLEVIRSSPIIEVIKNQSVVVGGNLAVACKAAASEPPEFNLVQYLPNGSEEPVEIGGKIKRRPEKKEEVYLSHFYSVPRDSLCRQKFQVCS